MEWHDTGFKLLLRAELSREAIPEPGSLQVALHVLLVQLNHCGDLSLLAPSDAFSLYAGLKWIEMDWIMLNSCLETRGHTSNLQAGSVGGKGWKRELRGTEMSQDEPRVSISFWDRACPAMLGLSTRLDLIRPYRATQQLKCSALCCARGMN